MYFNKDVDAIEVQLPSGCVVNVDGVLLTMASILPVPNCQAAVLVDVDVGGVSSSCCCGLMVTIGDSA